jgi:hypothetical protein
MIRFLTRRRLRWLLGFAGAFLALLALGEGYLRFFPPRDFQQYLGDDSPLTGPYRPDHGYGLQYRDWPTFVGEYRETLSPYLPFPASDSQPKVWAMFGNSFVQAPGMLADTAREQMPQRTIFNLKRNEPLAVRLAQIELLLENGLKPDRIFVALLPLDWWTLHLHSLDQIQINQHGALTYRVRNPGGTTGWLLEHSRLFLTGWIRTKMHHAVPHYNPSRLPSGLDASVFADARRLLLLLKNAADKHQVPVTLVLIPNFEQIVKGASFRLHDQLKELGSEIGLDVCDTREVFLKAEAKRELFIPDKHFSPRGNSLLLQSICRHLGEPLPTEVRGNSEGGR